MTNSKDVTFLLVEDDEVDVLTMQRAFKSLKISNDLVIVRSGVEALAALRGTGDVAKVSSPYIILLDLNLPKMNGIEFLDAIRQDPDHHTAVVFALTTSSDERDKQAAYERHVAGYIVKSEPADAILDVIMMIDRYQRVVELP